MFVDTEHPAKATDGGVPEGSLERNSDMEFRSLEGQEVIMVRALFMTLTDNHILPSQGAEACFVVKWNSLAWRRRFGAVSGQIRTSQCIESAVVCVATRGRHKVPNTKSSVCDLRSHVQDQIAGKQTQMINNTAATCEWWVQATCTNKRKCTWGHHGPTDT